MNRWLVLAALLLPNCAGCVYYAYPSLSYVPELTVPNQDGSVHAFRVDIDRTERSPLPPLTQYTLARVSVNDRGQIPSQLEVAPVTGVYNPLGIGENSPHERSEYSMTLRLYRPGYQTQEVRAWGKSHEVLWVAAADLAAKEKAIDDLLAPPSLPGQSFKGTWWEQKDDKSVGLGLQPGLISQPLHQKTLFFTADQFDKLVESREASQPAMQAVRDRLRSKSQWLKSYAQRAPAFETR